MVASTSPFCKAVDLMQWGCTAKLSIAAQKNLLAYYALLSWRRLTFISARLKAIYCSAKEFARLLCVALVAKANFSFCKELWDFQSAMLAAAQLRLKQSCLVQMAAFCTGCRINKAIGQIFAQKRIITLCKPIQANDMPNHSQEMLIARHLVDFLSSRASCEPAAHLRCSLAAQLSAFSLGADARILAYFAAALLVHCEYELKCARIGSKLPNLCSGCYAATSIQ